jgi:hypothetical protein
MDEQAIFDPDHGPRTADEWAAILRWAVGLLEIVIGVPAKITAHHVSDDVAGDASHDNGLDIVFETEALHGHRLCGMAMCLINVGEGVWIDAELLSFQGPRRTRNQETLQYQLRRTDDGPRWIDAGWQADAFDEWASHSGDARWRDAV